MKTFTKETLKRAARTFLQAAVAYIAVNLVTVDFTSGKEVAKSALIGLGISALSAGLAAVMNLQSAAEEKGGADMTLDDFLNKYKVGKSYAYNGTYKGECVSLVKNYIKEVLGATPKAIGNAKDYWAKRNGAYLKGIFTPIANTPSFVPQRGDVFVRTSGTYGHIGIVLKATKDYFYTIEQNYNGCRVVKNIKHTDWRNINFLRPKDQSNIKASSAGIGSFPTPRKWQNGSTDENVYADNRFKNKIGTFGKKAATDCYSRSGDAYVILYTISTGAKKAGFVKYNGGTAFAPPQSKEWQNGSTPETVYTDTKKGAKAATVKPHDSCYCLGRIDGMYLLLAKDGSFTGFADYHGGC